MTVRRVVAVAAAVAAVTMLLAGCGKSDVPASALKKVGAAPTTAASTPAPGPSTTVAPTSTTLGYPVYEVATAQVPKVSVWDAPGQGDPSQTFANPNPFYGSTRVFLVKQDKGDWLNVYLPERPNGATGWIRRSDVTLASHDFHIVVELGAHHLTAYEKNDVILDAPVAVGASATPSTEGFFYTTELIAVQPSQQSAYGPYAYGLSAYSEVFTSFGAGDGQMGIHGTGDPSSVGKSVSNGCIRLTNENITKLREVLPIGTPVEIRA